MPLVSVIIPTHERARYAVPTIRSLLALSEQIEVVVCDTSKVDDISPAILNAPAANRLRIIRPNRPMSVVDNFNEALSTATGKYLVFIGDDDFVAGEVVAVAKWAATEGIDAVKFTFPALYYWPDFTHKTQGGAIAGTLRISAFDGSIKKHDAKMALKHALANLGGGVGGMPRAYVGMVSAELVSEIQDKYGPLFGGVSPDIYSAALISLEAKNCVKIDYPVIVPGFSGASTAGQSANGTHVGGLRDNAHIGAFKNLVWDERIPEFYSVPTVWSYSLLKAAETARLPAKAINFPRLYTKCLIYQNRYRTHTYSAIKAFLPKNSVHSLLVGALIAILYECAWIAGKLMTRVKTRLWPSTEGFIQNDLPDTEIALAGIESYLAATPVRLKYPTGTDM
jgi:glycosyltransferase involved in cell wall biosynthesis